MHEILQEHVLSAIDVCNNCFRIVRVERERPDQQYESDVTVGEAAWARNRETTSVEYAPAEHASDSKGVFCTCGVEGSFVRTWNGETVDVYRRVFDDETADVDGERFREFVTAAIRALEHKGVSLDRQTFASHALQARRDGKCVNEALSAGVSHAIARAEATSRTRVTA